MCKRLFFLFFFVLLVALVSNASAVVFHAHWTDGGADHFWSNPNNWGKETLLDPNVIIALGRVPNTSDEVYVDAPVATVPNGPIIENGIDAQSGILICEASGEATLTMTGGTLTVADWGIWWGDGPGATWQKR